MKINLPSLRTQFIFLLQLVLILSVLFYRYFFIQNFKEYKDQVRSDVFEEKIDEIYTDYNKVIPRELQDEFKEDVEFLLTREKERSIATDFFRREIELYSIYILAFIIIAVFFFSLFTMKVITRPLERLQTATARLSRGELNIHVAESPYSPLNDLIKSFNRMVKDLVVVREKLIAAEKETLWREMARVMAHEIKNPLTPLQLTTERLEIKLSQSPEAVLQILPKSLKIIQEEITSLKHLTVEFSQFARMPEPHPEELSINELISEVVKAYDDKAEFILDTDPDTGTIHADKFQIRQALVNLIQNALQACKSDPQVRITTRLQNDHVCITIADNGKGIPDEDMEKIFEPYFSTRKKGTGLGLPIVKRIIEQHGGTLSVNSIPGEGTTIIIFLPGNSVQSPDNNSLREE